MYVILQVKDIQKFVCQFDINYSVVQYLVYEIYIVLLGVCGLELMNCFYSNLFRMKYKSTLVVMTYFIAMLQSSGKIFLCERSDSMFPRKWNETLFGTHLHNGFSLS